MAPGSHRPRRVIAPGRHSRTAGDVPAESAVPDSDWPGNVWAIKISRFCARDDRVDRCRPAGRRDRLVDLSRLLTHGAIDETPWQSACRAFACTSGSFPGLLEVAIEGGGV